MSAATVNSAIDSPITVGDTAVPAGERARIEIPVARLPSDTWLSLPIEVVHGRKPGPRVWLTAAVHGDELNGVEIIRRVLRRLDPRSLSGALVAVPIVNVFGFVNESRYLPDRRDLNRSFPGTPRGSLGSRLAWLLMTEVVQPCQFGIDLHTGSDHRFNLPQVRADLDDPDTHRIASAFAAPVTIHARTRDGSLRESATAKGCHVLLFEGGEANRFDSEVIEVGVRGVLAVLAELGMRNPSTEDHAQAVAAGPTRLVDSTSWIRARRSGILRLDVNAGDEVAKGQTLGVIANAFGQDAHRVKSPFVGIVIGHTRHPLVSQGDALVHVAELLQDRPHRRRVAEAPFVRQR